MVVVEHQSLGGNGYTSVQHAAVICLLLDHGGVCDLRTLAEHLAICHTKERSMDAAGAVLKSMVAAKVISITPRSPCEDHMADPANTDYQGAAAVTAPSHLQLYVWKLIEEELRVDLL
jgi:hypothetical protein